MISNNNTGEGEKIEKQLILPQKTEELYNKKNEIERKQQCFPLERNTLKRKIEL